MSVATVDPLGLRVASRYIASLVFRRRSEVAHVVRAGSVWCHVCGVVYILFEMRLVGVTGADLGRHLCSFRVQPKEHWWLANVHGALCLLDCYVLCKMDEDVLLFGFMLPLRNFLTSFKHYKIDHAFICNYFSDFVYVLKCSPRLYQVS